MRSLSLLVFLTLCGCGGDLSTPNKGIGELEFPSRTDFPLVSDAMQLKCGSLDCHGQIGRNLRLFGHYGLRLADADNPFDPPTTEEEYQASYLAVVGLEPEELSKVVKKEESPVQLSFVRKPRGLEKHKGFQLMSKGDALDRCIVGWLIGPLDPDGCNAVIANPKPDGGQ